MTSQWSTITRVDCIYPVLLMGTSMSRFDTLPMPPWLDMNTLRLGTHSSSGMGVGHMHEPDTNAIAWTWDVHRSFILMSVATNKDRYIQIWYAIYAIRWAWTLQDLALKQVSCLGCIMHQNLGCLCNIHVLLWYARDVLASCSHTEHWFYPVLQMCIGTFRFDAKTCNWLGMDTLKTGHS